MNQYLKQQYETENKKLVTGVVQHLWYCDFNTAHAVVYWRTASRITV